jgi:hypothetical protein
LNSSLVLEPAPDSFTSSSSDAAVAVIHHHKSVEFIESKTSFEMSTTTMNTYHKSTLLSSKPNETNDQYEMSQELEKKTKPIISLKELENMQQQAIKDKKIINELASEVKRLTMILSRKEIEESESLTLSIETTDLAPPLSSSTANPSSLVFRGVSTSPINIHLSSNLSTPTKEIFFNYSPSFKIPSNVSSPTKEKFLHLLYENKENVKLKEQLKQYRYSVVHIIFAFLLGIVLVLIPISIILNQPFFPNNNVATTTIPTTSSLLSTPLSTTETITTLTTILNSTDTT